MRAPLNIINIMLSVIILTKNERENITKVIQSVKFASEIVVVDNGSTDKTLTFAKKYNTKIIDASNIANDFARLRNLGMRSAKGDWILFLDSDEEILPELQVEIKSAITSNEFQAYKIKRKDIFLGKSLSRGELAKAYNQGFIRLVRKGSGEWVGAVHEEFRTDGSVQTLKYHLIHRPHNSVSDFITKINHYSTIRALELKKQGKSSNALQIIFFPSLKFIYTYFILFGFLDGAEGFIYSFMMSFHSFLSRSKLYTS